MEGGRKKGSKETIKEGRNEGTKKGREDCSSEVRGAWYQPRDILKEGRRKEGRKKGRNEGVKQYGNEEKMERLFFTCEGNAISTFGKFSMYMDQRIKILIEVPHI